MLKRLFFLFMLIVLLGFLGGYPVFTTRIKAYREKVFLEPVSAEGIVVLTGADDSRIQTGLKLLKAKNGQRLLISGVHAQIRDRDLIAYTGEDSALFLCCVDLGYAAQNTWGNAREAALWAGKYKYQTFLLITSDYHMPRAHMIFEAMMPEYNFMPYVTSSTQPVFQVLGIPFSGKLIREYTKFILTIVFLKFDVGR